jgi:hypothetical protein
MRVQQPGLHGVLYGFHGTGAVARALHAARYQVTNPVSTKHAMPFKYDGIVLVKVEVADPCRSLMGSMALLSTFCVQKFQAGTGLPGQCFRSLSLKLEASATFPVIAALNHCGQW